jgi:hypothetical protein
MRSIPTLLFLALLPLAAKAITPAADYVRPGARVRITLAGSSQARFVGTLASQDADSLRIVPDGSDQTFGVSLTAVKTYEVSRERHSNAGRGAGIGLLLFAPLGIIGGATCDCGKPGSAAIMLGMITGGLGAALGAVIGSTASHDVWESVPGSDADPQSRPASLGLLIGPSPASLGLTVGLRLRL